MDDRQAYQIKIALFRSDPLVWRTVVIPKDATLDELHECIQLLFGWMDIHDYYFEQIKSQKKYVRFPDDWNDGERVKPISSIQITLHECFMVGDQWKYVYDMENDWCHDLWIVKEVTLEKAGEPQLVEWAEDNLAENADAGVTGFYEKQAICEQADHPQHRQMREWMETQHRPFDAEAVQHALTALRYERIALPPAVMIADCCESLFALTNYETLIRVQFHDQHYDVLFIDHDDEERNIQIFRSEADFLDSYLAACDRTSIHPLYQNGYVLHFPCDADFALEEFPEEMLEPQLLRYERGKGNTVVSKEEFDELFTLLEFLAHMQGFWEHHLGYLPDLHEAMILNVVRKGNHVQSEMRSYHPMLKKSRLQLGKNAQAALTQGKDSDECLQMNLLPIPDLVSGDSDYAFYIAATGKKTGFLHRLHTNQKNAAMKEVRDQFITYMMEYGIPKEIDVEDQHLYQMLIQVCKDLKVKILWKAADPEILSEQFEEAMCEQNPISALDQRMLESLAHLSEAELLAYVEQQPDEKIKKILKQLLYMSLFRKE